jgi:acyl-CoA dehydrogenase
MFISTDENDPIQTLEAALTAVIAAEPIEQKIRAARKTSAAFLEHDLAFAAAQGIISKGEADIVQRARALRRKAIMVDDFPKDLGRTEIYQTTQPVSFEALHKA